MDSLNFWEFLDFLQALKVLQNSAEKPLKVIDFPKDKFNTLPIPLEP